MSPDYEADLARLRAIALKMPGSAEKLSHGSPCFHIEGGKAFAYIWHNHHNDQNTAVMVKVTDNLELETLLECDPALYYKPPYLGPSGWIAIRTDVPETDWDHIADRVAQSWELVAPRALLEAGGR